MLLLEAARTQTQAVRNEQLIIEPCAAVAQLDAWHTGERRAVFTAAGEVEVRYSAAVNAWQAPVELAGLPGSAIRDLPPTALSYLSPSRYCPWDRLQDFVDRQFRASCAGDKVLAVLAWLRSELTYRCGVSDARPMPSLPSRPAGVCRDFTHLAIASCRAANIPARAVSTYAWRLDPPDMHAIAEVFVGGRWRLIDPTGRARAESMVRVATRRDAAISPS